ALAGSNTMAAAINGGLEQKLFGLHPDGGSPEARSHTCEFAIGGIPGLGYVHAIGRDELRINAALWPTTEARRWIVCGNMTHYSGKAVGEVAASGWLERRTGHYLMPSPSLFYCPSARKPIVAALDVAPQGYKDHGRFIF